MVSGLVGARYCNVFARTGDSLSTAAFSLFVVALSPGHRDSSWWRGKRTPHPGRGPGWNDTLAVTAQHQHSSTPGGRPSLSCSESPCPARRTRRGQPPLQPPMAATTLRKYVQDDYVPCIFRSLCEQYAFRELARTHKGLQNQTSSVQLLDIIFGGNPPFRGSAPISNCSLCVRL